VPKVSDTHLASRRQQIVDAATGLFAERGFSRTTMADVVTASGLSTGAVYRYFSSKSDLVLAVVAGRDGRREGEFTDETPAELIIRLAGYVSPGTGAAHAQLIAQIWGDAAVVPDLAVVVRASHQRLQAHLTELITQTGHQDVRDSQVAAAAATTQVALAALVGLAALVASGIPVDPEAFVRTVTQLISPLGGP